MPSHAIKRFLRSHFHPGPKIVMMLSEKRIIIQVAGLHRSFGGKLPNAYKGRFDVTTAQLALNISHLNVFRQTKLIINMKIRLIMLLDKLENKVFLSL